MKLQDVDWVNNALVVMHDAEDVYLSIVPNFFIAKVKEQGLSVSSLEEKTGEGDGAAASLYEEMQEISILIDSADYYEYVSC